MGQLDLANVPTEGWTIDSDVHGLLDGLCNVMHLPTHNGEVFPAMMTCGVGVVLDGDEALRCFLSLSSKVLADYPMYFLLTLQPVTLVYYSTVV